MKKRKAITYLIIITLLVISAIISAIIFNINSQKEINNRPIYLLVDTWAGFTPLYVAYENGFFEDEGVLVKFDILTDTQTVGDKIMEKGSFYDGYPQVYPQVTGDVDIDFSTKAVYVFDYSYGGDAIIADKSIKSISDLKGKTVSVIRKEGFSFIFLVNLLEKNNLTEEDVNIVAVPAYEVLNEIKNGRIDAGHTWDPVKTEAVQSGYNLIGSSKDTPGLIIDVLAIKTNIIEKRPDEVQGIVNALLRAYQFIEENGDEAYSLMSNKTGVSLSDLAGMASGIKLLGPEENLVVLTDSKDSSSLYETSKYISDFMLKHGQLNKSFSANELVDSSFIENAMESKRLISDHTFLFQD